MNHNTGRRRACLAVCGLRGGSTRDCEVYNERDEEEQSLYGQGPFHGDVMTRTGFCQAERPSLWGVLPKDSGKPRQDDPNRPEDVLKVDADEDGVGGDDAADALRYLVATKARSISQRKLRGL